MTAAAKRHLRAAPDPAEVLRHEIAEICAQIDVRLGSRAGTAERGTYFWYWPPRDITSIKVLTRLHADAVRFLVDVMDRQREELAP
jgi:hypothetical protein